MILSTVKRAQWDKSHSRELLGPFICVCIALCTTVANNIAHNRPEIFPSYPPITIAPMMSIWGKGGPLYWNKSKLSTNIVAEERSQLLSSFLCAVVTKTQRRQVSALFNKQSTLTNKITHQDSLTIGHKYFPTIHHMRLLNHTNTLPLNDLYSRKTWVSQHQNGSWPGNLAYGLDLWNLTQTVHQGEPACHIPRSTVM